MSRKNAMLPWIMVLSVLPLVSCSGYLDGERSLAEQWQQSSDSRSAVGDGSTTSFTPNDRAGAIAFTGVTEHGTHVGSDQLLGSVVVVNFWYAGCGPCRAEAADLVQVHKEFAQPGVKFIGVNTRDGPAQAIQFAEEFGVPYPSIIDSESGRSAQRAFSGQVPLNAVPTTLVLDRNGRVAHRVVGQLAAASQLRTLVAETISESE